MPEFTDTCVLGRSRYGILFDNSYHWAGQCDRHIPTVNGIHRGWIGDEPELNPVFEGFHWLADDAKSLYYQVQLVAPEGSNHVALYYAYGSAHQKTICTLNATGTASGFYDLSTVPAGFYKVRARFWRDDIYKDADVVITPPFTMYTGALAVATPPTIADGDVGLASQLNTIRANDYYFNSQVPQTAAMHEVATGFIASETKRILLSNWVAHQHTTLGFKFKLRATAGTVTLRIYYNGVSRYTYSTSGEATIEATCATGAAALGAVVEVKVQLERANDTNSGDCQVYYVETRPTADLAGFVSPGALQAHQYVYGSTAGQDTRAAILAANQNVFQPLLLRRDWTVRGAGYNGLGASGGDWRYWIHHQRDVLVYRVENAKLAWGSNDDESGANETYPLEDFDDAGGYPYRILDLRTVSNLLYGAHYRIEGSLEYAAEVA